MENKNHSKSRIKPNRLALEKSPYLLQHAHNPVDWYPWGSDAFEKAKKEDKPIFLSSGYSTCHWCHVMEKESYEDEEVAKLMNEVFVSIKIDREERPDIDGIYMKICQAMTGSGGWPLNIILTPDKKPFFAATYLPKKSKFGRQGMMEIIPQIRDIWKMNKDRAEALAAEVISSLKDEQKAGEELKEDVLNVAYEQLLGAFDEQYGGFGGAPKFPTPHNLMFLLRNWKRTGDIMALRMVERTLLALSMGGIYDHVGSGFHRYSTDAGWIVPHFEKMLYDQALLAMAYTEAYQATGNDEFKRTAREIFTYVLRDMTSPEGGFYSAEDADSEGVEGRFYVWAEEEIDSILGEDSELMKKVFGIDKHGNFREKGSSSGKNILHLSKTLPELEADLKLSAQEILRRMSDAKQKLFAARENRVHPGKDDKILADWNGLMIAALAKGASTFNKPEYADAACRAADFILSRMRGKDGRLFHRYREGEADVMSFLDDHAFLTWGLIELYEATFKVSYLNAALEITQKMIEHFWDKEKHGLYFTADDGEELIFRKKEIYDGALPSGNSVAMLNLSRLGRMTANMEFEEKAAQIGRAFSGTIWQMPMVYTQMMVALDFALGPTSEVVIAGEAGAEDTKAMLAALRREFMPGKVVILRTVEDTEIIGIAEYARDLKSIEGRATAYVCRNYSCQLPVTDAGKMMELLRGA
ncbi:MAG: thioredoxin domain-containing protein [Candidatus Methanoperedens sp.]|nr:thioredoxin domain-containing protein [Candidatus Methanoperedens sp.]